jgi:hypothetical protein
MLSYHNDPAVKLKYQTRFEAHRKADEVIQGTGFSNGRGCFVGCTLDKYDHTQFPVELGWPEWLAILADVIFEGISKANAAQFGTDLLEAVPVGKDLEPVKWHLAIWRHNRQIDALKNNNADYAEQVRTAILNVIDYCNAQLNQTATEEQRSAAESAAELAAAELAAAESAWPAAWSARSAAWSARSAAESARSAAESARSAAESAESAAESAWSAVRSAAWIAESEALLKILRSL